MYQTQLQNTQHCMGWRLYPLLIIPIALPQKTMIICIDFDEISIVQFSIKLIRVIPSR